MGRYIALVLCVVLWIPGCKKDTMGDDGVSAELAKQRHHVISDVNYKLSFIIPEGKTEEIKASETLAFNLRNTEKEVLIDFRAPSGYLHSLIVNGITLKPVIRNNHIVIPAENTQEGPNVVIMEFRAGDMSLNRNDDYLYTLFVPDRACTAFPCFDQPDIKAHFYLTLNIPADYEAISNNPEIRTDTLNNRKIIYFDRGKKISTYLFAFAAGRFKRIEKEIDGFRMEMLHRETNQDYIDNNADEIFRLHYNAVRWLENYTGIKYPFPKFGFVLIPSFQYSGMEHPGAITYRASGLLLDESPTLNDQLNRASLIAHETAHIWFGDLVTMKWFDDVWLKEVFAGLMSDKIVNPDFPSVNHDLRFLLSRYPAAYTVDRTKGANPVIQKLDNIKNAGSLYGAIIYNKAPIVMRHLEQITGEEGLRKGIRIYLDHFRYANAEWNDLITILEEITSKPLKEWSQVWMREAGMPIISPIIEEKNGIYKVSFEEADPADKNRHWHQSMKTLVLTPEELACGDLVPGDTSTYVTVSSLPLVIIPDTTGLAYGCFITNNHPVNLFKKNIRAFSNPVERGVFYINAAESMFAGNITPEALYKMYLAALQNETEVQLTAFLAGKLPDIFWNRLDERQRESFSNEIEEFSWNKLNEENEPSVKKIWFILLRNISLSEKSLSRLYSIWESGALPGDVTLSEDELSTLAFSLALREYENSDSILARQYRRITNEDRKKRFAFIAPSLSGSQTVRDDFFESLSKPENREQEPWVIEALGYLHHPLRAANSEKYIKPSLEMLTEIKATGDIFFPGNWISATLSGHHSQQAHRIVEEFLMAHRTYPQDLRLKILQAEGLMLIRE